MRTPDRWDTARVTVGIALATGLAHLILSVFELLNWAVVRGAFVPAQLTTDLGFVRVPFLLTPLTATLIHADLFHLIFNLLIFLLCGRAVEGALGPVNLVIL
jgi:membrane associated rhomboid family serine protease